MRTCTHPECPEDNPQPKENFYRNRQGRDGLQSWCKTCLKKRITENSKTPGARLSARKSQIRCKYDLEWEEYQEMLQAGCNICGATERLHVDHDHSTGRVRGILCVNCNHGLGRFRDNPELLSKAIFYLSPAT